MLMGVAQGRCMRGDKRPAWLAAPRARLNPTHNVRSISEASLLRDASHP